MRKRSALGSATYDLGITYASAKSYYMALVRRFSKRTGIRVDYDMDDKLPLIEGVTTAHADGHGEVLLGLNGLTVERPDSDKVYGVDIDDDTPVADLNFVCGAVVLEHELRRVFQNYAERGYCAKLSEIARRCDAGLQVCFVTLESRRK